MHYQKVCLENITLPKCLPKCEGSKIVSLIQDSIDVKAQTESRFTMEKLNKEYKLQVLVGCNAAWVGGLVIPREPSITGPAS